MSINVAVVYVAGAVTGGPVGHPVAAVATTARGREGQAAVCLPGDAGAYLLTVLSGSLGNADTLRPGLTPEQKFAQPDARAASISRFRNADRTPSVGGGLRDALRPEGYVLTVWSSRPDGPTTLEEALREALPRHDQLNFSPVFNAAELAAASDKGLG